MWSCLLSVNQQSEGYILVLLSRSANPNNAKQPSTLTNHSFVVVGIFLKKKTKQTCRELQGFICAEIWDLSCLEGQRISSCWITTVIQSEATAAWGTNAALIDWCAKQRTDRRQASKNQRKKPIALSSPSTLDNFWIFYSALWCLPFHCVSSIWLYESLSICVF